MLNLSSSSSLPSIQKLFSHFFHMPFGLVVMAPSSNFNVISDAFAHGTHLHRVVVCICATIDKTVQWEEEEKNPRLLLRNPSKTDRLMLCARRVEFSSFSFIVVVVRHHHRQHNRHTILFFVVQYLCLRLCRSTLAWSFHVRWLSCDWIEHIKKDWKSIFYHSTSREKVISDSLNNNMLHYYMIHTVRVESKVTHSTTISVVIDDVAYSKASLAGDETEEKYQYNKPLNCPKLHFFPMTNRFLLNDQNASQPTTKHKIPRIGLDDDDFKTRRFLCECLGCGMVVF